MIESFLGDCVALIRAVCNVKSDDLSTLSTDAAGQLDVLWHDGDTLGVDGAQVGVLEKTNQVSLASLLQGHDGRALESQVGLEVLGDFTDQTLEWQFPDEQLGALLVTSDFSQSDGTWPVPVRFLHSASGWCALASGLGGQLLTRSLSSGRLSCGLLCSCHVECWIQQLCLSRTTVVFICIVFIAYAYSPLIG